MKQKLLSVCGYQKKKTSGHAQSCEDGSNEEPSESQTRDEIVLVQAALLRALTRCNAMGLGVQAQQTLLRCILQRADGSITPGQPRAHPKGARDKAAVAIRYCDVRAERITEHCNIFSFSVGAVLLLISNKHALRKGENPLVLVLAGLDTEQCSYLRDWIPSSARLIDDDDHSTQL